MLRIASRLPLALLLIFTTVTYAKPKTIVKVVVEGEITDLHHEGDLSSSLGSLSEDVTYLNVTVTPDDSASSASATPAAPSAPLMNDGKWCIKSMTGQTVHLTPGGSYSATLDGSFIDLEVPQAKGKPLKVSFTVFDHKWRSTSDLK